MIKRTASRNAPALCNGVANISLSIHFENSNTNGKRGDDGWWIVSSVLQPGRMNPWQFGTPTGSEFLPPTNTGSIDPCTLRASECVFDYFETRLDGIIIQKAPSFSHCKPLIERVRTNSNRLVGSTVFDGSPPCKSRPFVPVWCFETLCEFFCVHALCTSSQILSYANRPS